MQSTAVCVCVCVLVFLSLCLVPLLVAFCAILRALRALCFVMRVFVFCVCVHVCVCVCVCVRVRPCLPVPVLPSFLPFFLLSTPPPQSLTPFVPCTPTEHLGLQDFPSTSLPS